MLQVYRDFAKTVPVPAVSNVHQLAKVLQESGFVNSGDINQVINQVQQRTGSDDLGIGIKAVQNCIFEAKAGGPAEVVERLSTLLLERFADLRD